MGQFSKPTELWAGEAGQLDIFPFMVEWRRCGDGGGGRGFESHLGQMIFSGEQKVGEGFWGRRNRFKEWFEFFEVHKNLKMCFKMKKLNKKSNLRAKRAIKRGVKIFLGYL